MDPPLTRTSGGAVESDPVAPRFYHCSSYDRPNERILLHGGLRRDKPSRLCQPNVYALEISSGAEEQRVWRLLETSGAAVPALCWHSAVFLDHTHWMIFGGKASNNQMSQAGYLLDMRTMVWSIMDYQSAAPEARGGHSLLRLPDGIQFVLFGGMDSTGSRCFNDVHIFNRETRKWHVQLTMNAPVGRFVHTACLLGNNMWVMGGLKGSLAKSTPCGDLWCLNVTTWEWSQPKQVGPVPEPGTYTSIALDGESGTCALYFGSKAFDDTRSFYHVMSVDSLGDGRSVTWEKEALSAENKPSVSEGHTCYLVGKNMYIIGGRPGVAGLSTIDVTVISRKVFVKGRPAASLSRSSGNSLQGSGQRLTTAPPALPKKKVSSSKKRLSQSATASLRRENSNFSIPSSRLSRVSNTVGPKSGRRALAENGSPGGTDLLSSGEGDTIQRSSASSDSVISPIVSPRGQQQQQQQQSDDLVRLTKRLQEAEEMIAAIQSNYESELSLRLEAESKAQMYSSSAKHMQDAYTQLQRETAQLFQLAVSEVGTGSGKEKLERRYEELRSTSSEAMSSNNTGDHGSEKQSRFKSEKSALSMLKGGKKDKLMEHHLECVDRVNTAVNKLITSSQGPKELPSMELDVDAIVTVRSSSPNTPELSKKQPKETLMINSSEKIAFSPFPLSIRELWKAADLTNEFCLFTAQRYPDLMAGALFCRAIQRIMLSPEDTRVALIESLIIEHLLKESEFLVAWLDVDLRDEVIENADEEWLISPPPDSYWEELLTIVEEPMHDAFAAYRLAIDTEQVRPRSSIVIKRTGHHQILASAETQLMERLAEMGTEEDEDPSDDAGEKEEFLFKKVTSEMVATEINYVTDLKGKFLFCFNESSFCVFNGLTDPLQ